MNYDLSHINITTRSGHTALLIAIWEGHIEIALLLLKNGAAISSRFSQEVPLIDSIRFKRFEVIKLLLEKMDAYEYELDLAQALSIAYKYDLFSTVYLLLKKGVNSNLLRSLLSEEKNPHHLLYETLLKQTESSLSQTEISLQRIYSIFMDRTLFHNA